jgi:hypothetical protein
LFARLFPLTGEVRLENKSASAVPLVLYSIESPAGALNPSPVRWLSITEHYDAPFGSSPGNGFIDPIAEWMKISTTPMELTEGVFAGPGGSVPAKRAISLGRIWNPAVPFDLEFSATEPNGQPISIFPVDGLDGDYDGNGTVDAADYVVWRKYFGLSTAQQSNNENADGNLNGTIDAADYAVWRNNFGLSVASGAAAVAGGAALAAPTLSAAVPEPAGALLLCIAAGSLLAGARRFRRR